MMYLLSLGEDDTAHILASKMMVMYMTDLNTIYLESLMKNLLKKISNKFISGSESIKILSRFIGNTDIVISYNPNYNFNKRLLKLCKKNGVKYVTDLTEWYDNNELKITDYLPNWLNMTYVNKKIVKNRIVISSYLDKYYPEGNNIIIPATCNRLDEKWSMGQRIQVGDEKTILIYAGNPAKKDKLHEIINAVEKIENDFPGCIQLNVLGIDRETYILRYKKLLNNSDISNAVQFLGRRKQEEVPLYYANADFMVLLRDATRKSNAGFPTKFAESMMSGTPVIANLTSDLGSYLNDGNNGFIVDAPTYESLYEVLSSKVIKIDSKKKENMHANARQTGKENFDFRPYISQMSNFINNLL